jgi:hypothetical protein
MTDTDIVTDRSVLLHGPAEAVDHPGTRPGSEDGARYRKFGPAHSTADHREG